MSDRADQIATIKRQIKGLKAAKNHPDTTADEKAIADKDIRRLKRRLSALKPSLLTRARRRRGHDDELRPGHREWDFDS